MNDNQKQAVICGSVNSSMEQIQNAKYFFETEGYEVIIPIVDDSVSKFEKVSKYIDRILNINTSLVVIVPKSIIRLADGSEHYEFGNSTVYEYAISKTVNKRTLIWTY